MDRILEHILLIVGAALLLLGLLDRRDGPLIAGAVLLAAVLIAASVGRSKPPE